MPANGQISTASDIAVSLVPEFEQGSSPSASSAKGYSGPYWKAKRVALRAGPKASTAEIEIPLSRLSVEDAPSVSLISSSSVAGIKGGTFVSVKAIGSGKGGVVFSGSVTNISQSIKPDIATITATDHKYLLDGFAIKGSFWKDGNTTDIVYRQGVHFVPNIGGEPNCALVSGKYVVCPPRMGLSDGEDPPTEPTGTQASYWTVKRVLAYLYYVFNDTTAATLANDFLEFRQINADYIVWPDTYYNAIDDDQLNDRRAKEMSYEGMKLLAALNALCSQAGPYGLWMQPDVDFKNMLHIVRRVFNTSSSNSDGVNIGRAANGAASDVLGRPVVTDGNYEEDFSEVFTLCTISGDLVYIERRVQSYGTATFEGAWTAADLAAWKAAIITPPVVVPPIPAFQTEAVRAASNRYKKVFRAYKVLESFDFQGGTTQSAYPRAKWPRKVLTHLITQTLDSGAAASDMNPVDVPILFELSDDGSNWILAPYDHGMQVDDEGLIWLNGLYQETDTGWSTWKGKCGPDATAVNAITARYIRATFAIPCDHRITQNLKVASDPTAGIEPLPKTDDSERLSEHLSRLYYADAAELYRRAIQKDAYPRPARQGGSAENDDSLLDDTDKLKDSVKRRLSELGRVQRSGRLIMPCVHAAYTPGMQIAKITNDSGLGSYVINACVHEVVLTETPQTTELVLG